MSSSPAVPRVAVIGGGIFGASAAVHLARLGAPVTLVTEGAPASGASGRSLSWLNSSRRRSPEYHRLRMIGIDRYRTLAAAHPDAAWLRFDGGLTWDADDAHRTRLPRSMPTSAASATTPGFWPRPRSRR